MVIGSFDAMKDLYEEKRSFTRRVIVAVVFCALMVGLLLARLGDLQLLQHQYFSTRADDNRMRVVAMPPVRGLIYAPTAKTRQAAVMTTATSDAGRKIFQPRRISWS